MRQLSALLFLSLAACGVVPVGVPDLPGKALPADPTEDVPQGAVTKVTVTGVKSLAFHASTSVSAVVEGTGLFSSEVTWSIDSGGGELSAPTGQTLTYTAPLVFTETPVTLRAVSRMDASKVGTLTFHVTPAPPASSFLASKYVGNAYQSTQRGDQYARYSPPDHFTEATTKTTYLFTRVSDTRVKLLYYEEYPQNVFVDLHPDGTLSIPDQDGGAWERGRCGVSFFIGLGTTASSGTWDYKGNLTLNWSSRRGESCTPPQGSTNPAYEYREHRVTAVRNPEAPFP